MKRRLFLVLLLLAGGAIVNVAVAWGFAMWAPDPAFVPFVSHDAPRVVVRVLSPDWIARDPRYPTLASSHSERAGFGINLIHSRMQRLELPEVMGGSGRLGPLNLSIVELCGWPFRSLMCGVADSASRHHGLSMPRSLVNGEIRPLPKAHNRLLPYLPLWPGFAINTVFYAVILWLLFAAPFALRRRRRIKRGLCPKCAYDLRGSDAAVCPECGATK